MPIQREDADIKLIAIDMDGTLLNDEQLIPEENRRAIKEAEAKGIHVVISTGRTLMTCRELAESLELSSFLITANGSEIWDSDFELVERKLLHTDHIQKLWDLRNKHNTNFWYLPSIECGEGNSRKRLRIISGSSSGSKSRMTKCGMRC